MSRTYTIPLLAVAIACWGISTMLAENHAQADDGFDPVRVNDEFDGWTPGLVRSSPSEIIVKFEPALSPAARRQIVQQNGCTTAHRCDHGQLQLVQIPVEQTPEQMVALFQADEAVEYAEPDFLVRATFVPDDNYFSFQWNLDNSVTGGIGMETAWDIQQGDPNVIVAILDTGVAYEDFAGFRQAPDLATTAFVPGYDFVNDDSHPNDDQGHGTHVCGTIAQSTNNGIGVAGVAFGCSIMPVKVLDANGVGGHFALAQGIHFAIEQGATIINMSLGGPDDSQTLRAAVAQAHRQGITFVCAVGNDFEEGSPISYPAAYDDFCLAVGAVRYDLSRAPYSNVASYIDVVAPGGDLLVDQNDDGYVDGILQQTFVGQPNEFAYWFFQGTSMATPHVAGVAALLASRGITHPDEIREAIEATAMDLGPSGWDPEYGWGIIDAAAAVAYHTPRRRRRRPGD